MAKKWLDSIEKQKKKNQFEVCDRQTARVNNKKIINPLCAEVNKYNSNVCSRCGPGGTRVSFLLPSCRYLSILGILLYQYQY